MFLKYTFAHQNKNKKISGIINLLSPVTFILFYIISHFLNTVCMSLSNTWTKIHISQNILEQKGSIRVNLTAVKAICKFYQRFVFFGVCVS